MKLVGFLYFKEALNQSFVLVRTVSCVSPPLTADTFGSLSLRPTMELPTTTTKTIERELAQAIEESDEHFHLPGLSVRLSSNDRENQVMLLGEEDANLWTTAIPEVEVHLAHWEQASTHTREPSIGDTTIQSDDPSEAPKKSSDKPCRLTQVIAFLKYFYSTALLCFCVVLVASVIFSRQSNATSTFNLHPAIAFCLFLFFIMWLSLLEGGLNCMIGLQQTDKHQYAASHVWTSKCTKLAHAGDNIERFIVGRQFLDLSCIFMLNFLATSVKGSSVLGLPTIVNDIFLNTGLAVILVVIVLGQLTSQINCAHSMLDFVNNRTMYLSTIAALAIEKSGLLHSVYLIQIGFAKVTGRSIRTHETPRSLGRKLLFWGRVALSTCVLSFSIVVMLTAMFQGKTRMWTGLPPAAGLIMLILLILFVGLLDGLQVAFFAVLHVPEKEIREQGVAWKNCKFIFSGRNLQTFLVGRQIFQTLCQFFIARLSTVKVAPGEDNLFGVPDGVQQFFNTGILGSIFATIIASLIWRVTASCFPFLFLSNPLSYCFLRFCILVESSGVCWSAWLVAAVHRRVAGLQLDESYIGEFRGQILLGGDSTDNESMEVDIDLSRVQEQPSESELSPAAQEV
ncbi:hypothetical protein MPSEU_000769600 [Mayamaea pseudoterrestris]|nr:hypothetical protein MPSEU_000769600 [Mayamaea pseudoterrestris]